MKMKNKLFRFDQFLVENVQVAKSILAKVEKDETDPNYGAIMAILAGTYGEYSIAQEAEDAAAVAKMLTANKQSPNVRDYAGWFVDLHFNKGVSIDELITTFDTIKTNADYIKDFEKPLTQLWSKHIPVFELIQDEIEKVKRKRTIKSFMNELPSKQKGFIDMNDPELAELIATYGELEDQKSFFVKVSKFKDYNSFKSGLKAYIEGSTAAFDEALAKYEKDPDIIIIKADQKMNFVLIQVLTYSSLAKHFGQCQWCIKSKSSWDSYLVVKNGQSSNQQFVIVDYDKPETDVEKYIAFTTDIMGNVSAAHSKADASVMNQIEEILTNYGIDKTKDLSITKENMEKKAKILAGLDSSAKLILGIRNGLYSEEENLKAIDEITKSGNSKQVALALSILQEMES